MPLDGRADQFLWYDNPAQARTIALTGWPTDALDGVDMELRITGMTAITCTVSDPAHTVTAAVPATPALVGNYAANFWDVTDPDVPVLRVRGLLIVSTDPRNTTSTDLAVSVTVVDGIGTLSVSIISPDSINGFPLNGNVSAAGYNISDIGTLDFDSTATFDGATWTHTGLATIDSTSLSVLGGAGIDGTDTPVLLSDLITVLIDLGLIASSTVVDPVQGINGGRETIQSHGNTGSTETIDVASANYHIVTQDQACTYTFTNPAAGSVAASFTLEMTSVTGAATWPASVKWPDATPPTLSGKCLLTFVTRDTGTTWLGFLAGKAIG